MHAAVYLVLQVLDIDTFSENVVSAKITKVLLVEFNGQKPPLHMNCGKAVYPKGLSRMLRGEEAGGRPSLIICSCSPSLTGSVAKDDPHQLCTSRMHTGSTHTHTHRLLCRDVVDAAAL